MLNHIRIISHLGEILDVDPRNPEESGFFFFSISGIGSGKAVLNSTDMALNDGAYSNSAKLEPRYINLGILFYPKPDIESTRHMAYRIFPTKQPVILIFETDYRTCMISGRVESNDPQIQSKMETTQVVVKCDDPHFYSTQTMATTFFGLEGGFEFPFSNESLTEGTIEFSKLMANPYQVVNYIGDSDIGVTIRIHATGPATNVKIYNVDTKEQISIDSEKLAKIAGSGIDNGDEIEICTVEREKHIFLLRNGVKKNILNAIGRDIDWFRVHKGDNVFTYSADSGLENLQFTIENRIIYEGV